MSDLSDSDLVDRGAVGAFQIRAGDDAYARIITFPRVQYSPRGENKLYWRGVLVIRDSTLGTWTVEVDR